MKHEPCISRIEYVVPELFSNIENLVALQTTRKGGISPAPFDGLNLGRNTADSPANIKENTLKLCMLLGIKPEQLAGSDQVHGTEIMHAISPGFFSGYDALVTNEKNIFLCIFTADCYPVLLCDTQTMAVAAIHSGWKGAAGGIVSKTVLFMQERFGTDPGNLLAWIGTGIAQSAYEVDAAVAGAFDSEHLAPSLRQTGKFNLDLAGANRRQLLDAGIPPSRIACSAFCSSADAGLFYSYRRDAGITGRMASIIGVTTERNPKDRGR